MKKLAARKNAPKNILADACAQTIASINARATKGRKPLTEKQWMALLIELNNALMAA